MRRGIRQRLWDLEERIDVALDWLERVLHFPPPEPLRGDCSTVEWYEDIDGFPRWRPVVQHSSPQGCSRCNPLTCDCSCHIPPAEHDGHATRLNGLLADCPGCVSSPAKHDGGAE